MNRKHITIPLLLALAANLSTADQQAARRQSIDAALTRWDDIKQRLSDNDLNQPYHHDETTAGRPAPAHLHTP